jgi:hypothetical protein
MPCRVGMKEQFFFQHDISLFQHLFGNQLCALAYGATDFNNMVIAFLGSVSHTLTLAILAVLKFVVTLAVDNRCTLIHDITLLWLI